MSLPEGLPSPKNHPKQQGEVARVSQEIYNSFVSLVAAPDFAKLPFEVGYSSADAKWVVDVAATGTTFSFYKSALYEDRSATIRNGLVTVRLEDWQRAGWPRGVPWRDELLLDVDSGSEVNSLSCASNNLAIRALLKVLGASPGNNVYGYIDTLLPYAKAEKYSGVAVWSDQDPSGASMYARYSFCRGEYPEARRTFSIYPADKTWGFDVVSSGLIGDAPHGIRYETFTYSDLPEYSKCKDGGWQPAALTHDRLQEVYETAMRSIARGRSMIEVCT